VTSPTQRSLAYLRKAGYVVAIVERWNPYAKIRQDLYGWIDLLALHPDTGELLAVQTTSGTNVSKRVDKIREWPYLGAWLKQHRAVVHGWAKRGERGKRKLWTVREVDVTEDE
jgi:carbonic anhydrase